MAAIGLICPVSSESIDKRAGRVGATLTAAILIAFVVTQFWPLLLLVAADYVVRVFTPYRPPLGAASSSLLRVVGIAPKSMNKGPKIFAWRVGFIMVAVSVLLLPISVPASVLVALALVGFNVLDGVFNLCVGCVVYTYVVLPFLGPAEARTP